MFRLLLGLIIITLLITYAILPFVKYAKRGFKKETKRIESSYIDNKIEKEKDDSKWVSTQSKV